MDTEKNTVNEATEVEEQGFRYGGREDEAEASEVDEQGIKVKFNEDEAGDQDDSDDDSDVDEQRLMSSDAALKHAIEHITGAFSKLA